MEIKINSQLQNKEDGANIVKLDEEDSVVGVECKRDRLMLRLRTGSLIPSRLHPESLIAGGLQWNCTGTGKTLGPVMREVVEVLDQWAHLEDEVLITIRTEDASPLDFFSDADVTFRTNILHHTYTHHEPEGPEDRPRRRRMQASVCQDACPDFESDGDCDDGGSGAEYAECTWGTDCADCGPREAGTGREPPPVDDSAVGSDR